MRNTSIEKQILDRLQNLEESQQLQVLNFAIFLATNRNLGVSGKSLLNFAGSIAEEDLELMTRAIDEECRKIDLDEW